MATPAPEEPQHNEPHWRSVEKVVALLEQILTPHAMVRHNVFLPVVGRPQRNPRQCDVVITSGQPPRQTTAIVEVQKRQEKPDINTFNGWVEKMREVGAQQLFCVSAQGYPNSIIDKAANELGPTVVLLHLEDLEQKRIPGLVLAPFLLDRHPHFTVTAVGKVSLKKADPPADTMPEGMQLNSDQKLFGIGQGGRQLSLDEIIAGILERDARQAHGPLAEPPPGLLEMDVAVREPELWFTVAGVPHKVIHLPVTLDVEIKTTRVPLVVQGYRQENRAGLLAWVATAEGDIGGRVVRVRLVFQPGNDGILRLMSIDAAGVGSLNVWLSPDKSVIESALGPVFGGTTT